MPACAQAGGPMSIYASTWVWDHSQATNGARMVLLAIADSLNQGSGRAWLSMTELQRKAKLARSSVNDALTALRALGEIQVVEGEIGPRGQTVYRMPKFQPSLPLWREGVTGTKSVPVAGTESLPPPEAPRRYENATSSESVLVGIPDTAGTESVPALVRIPDTHTSIRKPESNRKGTDVLATPVGAAPPPRQLPLIVGLPDPTPPPEGEGQRVNRLARTYTSRVPLSKFIAVAGVVRAAVRAADRDGQPLYTDQQLTDGLARLVEERRAVTIDTLRIALEGPPRTTRANGHQPWRNTFTDADYEAG